MNELTITPEAKKVLQALRDTQESEYTHKGGKWGSVYLDNAYARVRGNGMMTRHSFAGYLSALHDAGLYDSQDDGFFGFVKLAD